MKTTQGTKQKKSPVNNRKTTGKRDTRFKKGQSGNPKGRPKGTTGAVSITGLVREELKKCPEGEDKKTYADLVVKRILAKAIKDGNDKMIEKIWAYMDGLPKQPHEFSGKDGDPLTILLGEISHKREVLAQKDDRSRITTKPKKEEMEAKQSVLD